MLTYAVDFWPLFWTISAGGAGVTVLLPTLVATFPRRGSGRVTGIPRELVAGTGKQSEPDAPCGQSEHDGTAYTAFSVVKRLIGN